MVTLSPRVMRLRAPNPSPMTLDGTNGYLIDAGQGELIAIDPGPDDPGHRAAFLAAARERDARIRTILVTHGHPDHFPGAAPLAVTSGALIFAHPAAQFPHDRTLADDERITIGEVTIRTLHAPGHAVDHLVFLLEDERALFTGDVIIGRGTVVIAPPGGDMRAYQRTLARLRDEAGDARVIYGGHGEAIADPAAAIAFYLRHREEREAAIVSLLAAQAQTIPALVRTIYRDVEERLWPAAARQVLAYLIALEREGRVASTPAERAPDASERAILEPDLARIRDPQARALAAAEFGYDAGPPPLLRYRLIA
jgi:glyoxylase-like metal-dependent hydrolase (beta-lactamase superfamily II)